MLFLLGVILLEFLPEVYLDLKAKTGLYIIVGLLFQLLLEFGSKGAEHGHIHQKKTTSFPWILFISLSAHSLVEGIPLEENSSLLYGILIHKIPIAVIISAFLMTTKMSYGKIAGFLIIFALMTPLGALLKMNIPALDNYSGYINAFVVGVLLHVSTTILFESSKNHQFNISKISAIVLGFVLAYFI